MTAADDLRTAVAALTEPTRKAVFLDPLTVVPGSPDRVHAEIPSLLEQLEDAAEQGAEGGGGRSVPGSRPPTGDDVLMVRVEIESGVAARRKSLKLPAAEHVDEGLTGLAERMVALVHDQTSPVTDDSVARLARVVSRWRRHAEQALRVEWQAREILGVPCPACCQAWAWPAGLHEHGCKAADCRGCAAREAALFILVGPFGARATECRGCGAVWWLGTAMDHLGKYTRAALDAGALAVKGRTA